MNALVERLKKLTAAKREQLRSDLAKAEVARKAKESEQLLAGARQICDEVDDKLIAAAKAGKDSYHVVYAGSGFAATLSPLSERVLETLKERGYPVSVAVTTTDDGSGGDYYHHWVAVSWK